MSRDPFWLIIRVCSEKTTSIQHQTGFGDPVPSSNYGAALCLNHGNKEKSNSTSSICKMRSRIEDEVGIGINGVDSGARRGSKCVSCSAGKFQMGVQIDTLEDPVSGCHRAYQ